MKKIIYICSSLILFFVLIQCQKEDMYARFSPEILYKRYVLTQSGMEWQVSPDAKEVTLNANESTFTVYARVSAPNQLKKITVYEVTNGKESEVASYNEEVFTLNPNVYELVCSFSNITSTKQVRTIAIDKIGNKTTRDFTIKK